MLTIRTTGLDDYLDGGSGRIKVLMMGPPKSGKTRSASFWPKPLLADCEEGRMSVADRSIPYAAIQATGDMKALLTLAESEGKRPKDQRRFETLIIDTLDSYQRIVIQEYLRSQKKAAMSGWQDWGHLDAEMTELVARLAGIPMNVVVNLHVKSTKVGGGDDGDGGILVHGPKLKGDLKDQIASEFDLVGFMETDWEAVDGKRTLTRYVQWEPSPDKPILGDRSGQLHGRTAVTFTEEDYLGLLRPMQGYMEHLKTGSVVAEVEVEEPAEHEEVGAGGPVRNVAASVTKKAAKAPAKKAAAKATAVRQRAPAAPTVTTPAPALGPSEIPSMEAHFVLDPDDPERDPTMDAAVEAIANTLGGQVIDVSPGAVMEVDDENDDVTTDVVQSSVVENSPNSDKSDTPEPQPPADTPGNGVVTVKCGDPRYAGGTVPDGLVTCRQTLVLDMQDDRVTGCSEPTGQIPDLIQIAGLKTRAFMCNTCFATHRNAAKK